MRRKDGILLSTLAGMIAALAKSLINFILFWSGALHVLYWQIAASAFVKARDIDNIVSLAVGGAADVILGGILGVAVLLVFQQFGRDLWWYKGLIIGNAVWLFAIGLAVKIFVRLVPTEPAFCLASLFEHQIFGFTAAFFV